MKRNRFTDEEIIGILREHEAARRSRSFAASTASAMPASINGRPKFGGMDVSEAKRLKTLEDENTKRKRLLADTQCSTIAALKDLWKECMVRLVRARVRDIANDGSSCINIPASCEWAAVAARP